MTSMTERVFVDTNVIVYTADLTAPQKRSRATAVMRRALQGSDAAISTQVLQEFYVVATRGPIPKLESESAETVVRDLGTLRVGLIDVQTVLGAVARAKRRQMSLWDALIVQSAVEGGCTVLLTEDLTHGEVIDGVRVVDPFQGDEGEVLALFG